MSPGRATLPRRKGDYGFDAPYVPILLGTGGGLLVLFAIWQALRRSVIWTVVATIYGEWLLLSTASYLYSTRRGKFAVWAELLRGLGLNGDERILDLGCGRGAVLLLAAQLVPTGKAVGVDLWKASDQSGNRPEATLRNAEREGVADRVELHTGDMQALPFEDRTFDVVVSSLAIHNIPTPAGRARAIDEGVRVLKPGGKLVIVDFRATNEYVERLKQGGLRDVRQQTLDWRFWYGGPWAAAKLITASKPV